MTVRTTKRSAIPVGTQFTPDLVDLPKFIQALLRGSGDKGKIEQGVWGPGVRKRPKKDPPTRRNRSLPVEAAVQYGLLDKDFNSTVLAERLATLGEGSLYREFGKHILLNLGGLRVLEGIQQMEADNLPITGDSLAHYLSAQGFQVGVHNTAINSLRMWLAKAGVFESAARGPDVWQIVPGARESLLGLSNESITVLAGLSDHQLAFVHALCAAAPQDRYQASSIRDLAAVLRPEVHFDRGSLPNDVLAPLKAAGIIDYETRGTRGGKSSVLWTTPVFDREVLLDFVNNTVRDMDAAVSGYFMKRPIEIYSELRSHDPTTKGRALEALAVRIMRLLGLRFVGWRRRAQETGFAEVDALLAGVFGAVPTRWQVQCKNTPGSQKVVLEDVAKEVGLVPLTRATHILFLANNDFTGDAKRYADQVMFNTSICVFLLGRVEFEQIEKDGSSLGRLLAAKAQEIVKKTPKGSVFAWR